MSIVYDGVTAKALYRDAMLASANSATIMAWLYPTTLPGSGLYNNAFAENNTTNTSGVGISLFNSAGTVRWDLGTETTDSTGSTASANVWKHLTLVKSAAASQAMYLDGVSDATDTSSGGGTRVLIGNFGITASATNSFNGRIAAVKIWDAALTAAEIQQELRQYLPVRLANFKAFFPFLSASDLTDYSGNAQSLTTNGTAPTSAEGPPIVWRQQNTRIFYVPAAAGGASVTPGVGALTLTGFAPAVATPQNVPAGVGALTLSGFAPTFTAPLGLAAGVGQLTLSGFAPSVATPQSVTAGVGQLTLSGFAPAISTGGAQSVLPGAGVLSLSGFAPTIATPRNVQAGVGALTLTGFAPSVQTPRNVTSGLGQLSLNGFAPTVAAAAAVSILAGVGVITVSGFAPTATVSVPARDEPKWLLFHRGGKGFIRRSR